MAKIKLPQVSGKEAIKALCKAGFEIKRQKGSHVHLVKVTPEKVFHVTVPVHGNEDLNPFVFRCIARQAGLETVGFAKLFLS